MGLQAEMCQKCGSLYFAGNSCGCSRTVSRQPAAMTSPAMAGKEETLDEATPPAAPVRALHSVPAPADREAQADPEPQADEPPFAVEQLSFHGSGGSLFGIQFANLLLTVVTLGIYSFWGKVRVRNFLWSQSEFLGDRFAYHGTGRELFYGSLKAGAVITAVSVPMRLAKSFLADALVMELAYLFAYVMILLLIPVAIIGSRRYRLSRTSWRGIRFSLQAPTADFVKLFLRGVVLTVLTLGFYYPVFVANKFGFLTSHTYFGSQPFSFNGEGKGLMRSYLLCSLLAIPTLGLSLIWWQAAQRRYLWSHTQIGGVRLQSHVTGGALLKLYLVNAILLLVSGGLAWPWVIVRNSRFAFEMLSLQGEINLSSIEQDAQQASAMGEGLGAAFELDAGFAA